MWLGADPFPAMCEPFASQLFGAPVSPQNVNYGESLGISCVIAVRSSGMIIILSALVSVLSFREHWPLGLHNDFNYIAFRFYNQNPRVLQLGAPFVRLARQPFLIDMLRIPHYHVH